MGSLMLGVVGPSVLKRRLTEPPEPLHGDNPDLEPTTPTVLLAVELVLSALGKTIMADHTLPDHTASVDHPGRAYNALPVH